MGSAVSTLGSYVGLHCKIRTPCARKEPLMNIGNDNVVFSWPYIYAAQYKEPCLKSAVVLPRRWGRCRRNRHEGSKGPSETTNGFSRE